MMKIKRFEDVEAWQVARELCRAVYEVISKGEFARNFALRDQIDRSSGSVMDNISEGFDSGTDPEFVRFLQYAQRSSSEVKSQLYRAIDRQFITQDEFNDIHELADKAYRKTGALIKYLKSCRK